MRKTETYCQYCRARVEFEILTEYEEVPGEWRNDPEFVCRAVVSAARLRQRGQFYRQHRNEMHQEDIAAETARWNKFVDDFISQLPEEQ